MTYWINEKLGVISLFESMTEEGVVIVDVRNISDVESDVLRRLLNGLTDDITVKFK